MPDGSLALETSIWSPFGIVQMISYVLYCNLLKALKLDVQYFFMTIDVCAAKLQPLGFSTFILVVSSLGEAFFSTQTFWWNWFLKYIYLYSCQYMYANDSVHCAKN